MVLSISCCGVTSVFSEDKFRIKLTKWLSYMVTWSTMPKWQIPWTRLKWLQLERLPAENIQKHRYCLSVLSQKLVTNNLEETSVVVSIRIRSVERNKVTLTSNTEIIPAHVTPFFLRHAIGQHKCNIKVTTVFDMRLFSVLHGYHVSAVGRARVSY